jgi:hypothetical protein
VGVAKTGRYTSLGEDPKPFFYRSLLQRYEPAVQLVAAVRDAVHATNARLAVTGAETLEQHMQLPLFPARAAGFFLGLFGGIALLLHGVRPASIRFTSCVASSIGTIGG